MAAWDSETRQFDQGDALDPYAVAPASSHVLWTTPLTFGGIIGGEFGTTSFYNGMSYEQFFKPPIIIGGNLYYNTIHGSEGVSFLSEDTQPLGFNSVTCVSLTTGETLFTIPNATVSFGQIFNFISPNQGGAFAYLWDTSSIPGIWRMYDAWTGQYILSVAMPSYVSGGTVLLDNTFTPNPGNGDVMVYSLNGATLTLWNSTLMFENYEAQLQLIIPSFQNIWLWRPYNWAGQTLDGSLGVQWNVTLANFPAGGAIAQVGYDNTVYIYNTTVPAVATFGFPLVSSWCGYSMTDGHQLWGPTTIDTTTKLPKDSTGFSGVGILQHQGIGSGGILPIFDRDTEQLYAWNVETGQFLWGPTNALTNPLGIYNWENEWIVDGILYNSGYDGMIHAYNATTGTHLWDYYSGNAGTITPYGTWPFYNGLTIVGPVGSVGNETMIATTGEHGNGVQPLYQGEGLYVLSAITGTPLWNIEGWFCQPVLADGVMVTQNLYDNQIYGFGQGPSKTTVSAPNVGVTTNTPVTISGTVTDISAGAQQQQVAADFPNGLPCVSDASMSQFMEAVYEQQPMPTNITGVPVTVYVLDSNNNYRAIGTTTTNAKGFYSLTWTPDITGNYTVTAVFAGSDSYYGSSANAAFYAGSPPATAAPAPTPASGLATQNALTYIGIAIIIVIIIIGAVIAILVTRKRP